MTLKIKICNTFSKSFRGLMFDNDHDGALICGNSVWMPFVKTHLLLFFLDGDGIVLSRQAAEPITLNPRTWRTYTDKRASCVLEVKL